MKNIIKKKLSLLRDFGVVNRKNMEEYSSMFERELSPVANDKEKLLRKADCLAERLILDALK